MSNDYRLTASPQSSAAAWMPTTMYNVVKLMQTQATTFITIETQCGVRSTGLKGLQCCSLSMHWQLAPQSANFPCLKSVQYHAAGPSCFTTAPPDFGGSPPPPPRPSPRCDSDWSNQSSAEEETTKDSVPNGAGMPQPLNLNTSTPKRGQRARFSPVAPLHLSRAVHIDNRLMCPLHPQ